MLNYGEFDPAKPYVRCAGCDMYIQADTRIEVINLTSTHRWRKRKRQWLCELCDRKEKPVLTLTERSLLRAKLRNVEEAVEDMRACLYPNATISFVEVARRSTMLRNCLAELKRYIEEELT